MEYIFLKVTRNSSSFKDMVKRVDTAASSMKLMEDCKNIIIKISEYIVNNDFNKIEELIDNL